MLHAFGPNDQASFIATTLLQHLEKEFGDVIYAERLDASDKKMLSNILIEGGVDNDWMIDLVIKMIDERIANRIEAAAVYAAASFFFLLTLF